MSGDAWHARVACGPEVGAGFLVSGRRLLTCAHVVKWADRAPVTVSFPGRRELGALSAAVAVHGGWQGGAADPGDLAYWNWSAKSRSLRPPSPRPAPNGARPHRT